MKGHRKISTNQNGFTLIEIIATMVIMGIIGIGAALFLTHAAQGFLLARTNQTVYQKANIAMERLLLEMKYMDQVTSINTNSIQYERNDQAFAIALVSGTIKLNRGRQLPDADTGFVLIDDVARFNLSFENTNGNPWTIQANNSLSGLTKVNIDVTLTIEGTTRRFTIDVNPLFNDMVNGPTT